MMGKTSRSEKDDDALPKNRPGWQYWCRRIWDGTIWLIIDQWFLIGTGIMIAIASQVQVSAGQQAVKQTVISYLAVTIIFFITGCTLDTKVLIQNYAKWKEHLFVQCGCFLLVSALGFAVYTLASLNHNFLDPWLLIGLIFNACQPTAIASNVMFTRKAKGNSALTVVETTIGNFIGPFVSPALISMYLGTGAWYTRVLPPQRGGYQAIYRRVFMQFGLSIYLPMFVGQCIQNLFPKTTKKVFVEWKLSKVGSVSLLLLTWQTFDRAFATGAFQSAKASNMIFIVFISIAIFFLPFFITWGLSSLWMDRKDTVAVLMCVPAKTLALGLPLSFLMYRGLTELEEAKIQIPLVILQIMQICMSSLVANPLRKWVEAGEKKAKCQDAEAIAGSATHVAAVDGAVTHPYGKLMTATEEDNGNTETTRTSQRTLSLDHPKAIGSGTEKELDLQVQA